MADLIYGSICLSAVPKELFKKVKCKNGEERIYLNIKVVKRKEVSQYGDTHFVSCAPKKEEQKEGTNYILGDWKEYNPQPTAPTQEDIDNAQSATDEDLPFDLRGVAA
jgi:hypothetical protein